MRARDGHTGPRTPGDIGFATLRGGTVTGDHTVIFAGPYERRILPGIGHNVPQEAPEAFARMVLELPTA